MNQEAFPLLFEELKKRGEKEAAAKVKGYFYNQPKEQTFKELQEEIAERFASGEPIDSIKEDFKDRGVDYQELMNSFINREERIDSDQYLAVAETVLNMQGRELSEEIIKDHLAKEGIREHHVDEILEKTVENKKEFAEEINRKFKRRRLFDLTLGPIIATVSTVVTIASLSSGNTIVILYGAIGYGFFRTIRGLASIGKTMSGESN
jgi:hypothetical protein